MGPRAKRRAALAAGIAVLAAGAGIAVYATHLPGASAAKEVYGTFGAFGVSYGDTRTQLVARVGRPDRKRNGCWIYDVHDARLGDSTVPAQVGGMDAVRYCFAEGVVSVIEDHWPPRSGWPHPWIPPVTYGCGGKKCVVTS